MLEYAPMLHVSYYAQNYAAIIRQGLFHVSSQFLCYSYSVKSCTLFIECSSCTHIERMSHSGSPHNVLHSTSTHVISWYVYPLLNPIV